MDNAEFVSTLKERGFYKTSTSHSQRQYKLPLWRSSRFYFQTVRIVYHSYCQAKKDPSYSLNRLQQDAYPMVQLVEQIGGKLTFLGLKNIQESKGPIVFIGNHMSALETFLLPAIILPFKDITFILKKGLLAYPFFGKVLTIFDPVTVTRRDPREDLRTVLTKGIKLLRKGRSIIVFPQKTRTASIDAKEFNTLGIKLAKKSGSHVIPVALKTDFWGNGRIVKDCGRIDPQKKVFIEFGTPFCVESNGKEEHQSVVEFIETRVASWSGNQ